MANFLICEHQINQIFKFYPKNVFEHIGDRNQIKHAYILNCFVDSGPPQKVRSQCDPSPCGPNSRCTISSQGYATCSCLPGFRGSPPVCSPECIVSSDCSQVQACINMKCVDTCNAVCGRAAMCSVINHNPICTCPPGFTGDPLFQCFEMESK